MVHFTDQSFYASGQKKSFDHYQLSFETRKKYRINESRTWYDNGQLETLRSYQDGKINGDVFIYTEKGSLRYQAHYQNNERHGKTLRYKDKKLISDEDWSQGKQSGEQKYFYSSGQLQQFKLFTPQGELTRNDYYQADGLLKTTWQRLKNCDIAENRYREGKLRWHKITPTPPQQWFAEYDYDSDGELTRERHENRTAQHEYVIAYRHRDIVSRRTELVKGKKQGLQIIQTRNAGLIYAHYKEDVLHGLYYAYAQSKLTPALIAYNKKYNEDNKTNFPLESETQSVNPTIKTKGYYRDGRQVGHWLESRYIPLLRSTLAVHFLADEKGVLQGKYEAFDKHQQLIIDGQYKKGMRQGNWYWKHPESLHVMRQGQFKDNLPIGTWTELYSLVSSHTVTGQYINGLREGAWHG